jgi:Chitin synthase export chaperone
MGLLIVSALALFIATGYIALDTGFSWTGHFDGSLHPPNRNIGLYVLYQLAPLVYLFAFFILESILLLWVLAETKPMSQLSFIPATFLYS